MVRFIMTLALVVSLKTGYSQPLVPINKESRVTFRIKNAGIAVTGSFKGLEGKIDFDPGNSSPGTIDVSIDANTIDTDNETRDAHLRKERYFDVKNYPRIHFVSTRIIRGTKAGEFILSGKLTIKNVTKNLNFPFTIKPVSDGYLFTGDFRINRRDFGVGRSSTISKKLNVYLEVVARKL